MTLEPLLSDAECLCLFDGDCIMPVRLPAIEQDEYAFIDRSLQRWRDRDFTRHGDPWRSERSNVKVWT